MLTQSRPGRCTESPPPILSGQISCCRCVQGHLCLPSHVGSTQAGGGKCDFSSTGVDGEVLCGTAGTCLPDSGPRLLFLDWGTHGGLRAREVTLLVLWPGFILGVSHAYLQANLAKGRLAQPFISVLCPPVLEVASFALQECNCSP